MPTCSQQSDVESRFNHLLQPIRDLTKNWEIDIAAYLDDYLEEIDHITISFDGGVTTMNFAEAALLIQGSVCVYGRKVEYLYTLVYQVMDLLANKKKMQQQAEKEGQGQENAKESVLAQTVDEEFLSLDDDAFKEIRQDKSQLSDLSRTINTPRNRLIDLSERVDVDKKTTNCEDQLPGNLFSTSIGFTSSTGLILSDREDITHAASNISLLPARTIISGPIDEDHESIVNTLPIVFEPNMVDDGNDENYDGLPEPAVEHTPPTVTSEVVREENCMALRQRSKENIISVAPQIASKAPEADVPLDPHKPTADQPMKKGCTWKLPVKLENRNKKKRSRSHCAEIRVPINVFCKNAFIRKPFVCDSEPLKITSYSQFEELYEAEKNRRNSLQRSRDKQIKVNLFNDGENEEEQNAPLDENDDAGSDTEDLAPEHDDLIAPDGQDNVWIEQLNGLQLTSGLDRFEEPQQFLSLADNVPVLSSYEELVAQYAEGFVTAAQQFIHSTELTQRIEEWEKKILPRLKEEEERTSFDIHQYGTYILDAFGDSANEGHSIKSLHEIVQNKPAYEVCRYFSAMLQLANAYNVEITNEDTMDTVALRLISRRRHFEEIADYRVPSLL